QRVRPVVNTKCQYSRNYRDVGSSHVPVVVTDPVMDYVNASRCAWGFRIGRTGVMYGGHFYHEVVHETRQTQYDRLLDLHRLAFLRHAVKRSGPVAPHRGSA